jgi:hypothetical protein
MTHLSTGNRSFQHVSVTTPFSQITEREAQGQSAMATELVVMLAHPFARSNSVRGK